MINLTRQSQRKRVKKTIKNLPYKKGITFKGVSLAKLNRKELIKLIQYLHKREEKLMERMFPEKLL